MSRLRALSPTGRSLTFDARADGYVRAEGCGVVVLKRFSDAVAAGDRIYAVIRGSEVMHGGRSAGPLAPNGKTEELLIKRALANAGVRACDVGYIEAHGTGTPLGDPIEFRAVTDALKDGSERTAPLLISSVKTNIGHAEGAAGVAGLIKTALCIWKGAIPPHVNFEKLNPNIQLEEIPARIPKELTPWTGKRRIAGVNSFGMTGILAHVLLEEGPSPKSVSPAPAGPRDHHVLVLSSQSRGSVNELAGRYAEFLKRRDVNLADICYTAGAGRMHFESRLAVVGKTPEEVRAKLEAYISGKTPATVYQGELREAFDRS